MNTLLVMEEYVKLTKGVCRVVENQCEHSLNDFHILLNREHWAMKEGYFSAKSGVKKTSQVPFFMPCTVASNVLKNYKKNVVVKLCGAFMRSLLACIYIPFFMIWFFFWLRKNNISQIICHHGGWPGGQLIRWVILSARLFKINKIVLVVHSYPAPYRKGLTCFSRLEERVIGFCADKIVTVSHAAAEALKRRNFQCEITVVHNGIDVSAPCSVDTVDKNNGILTIGYLGALVPAKGVHILLEAFAKISLPCRLALGGPADPDYLSLLKLITSNSGNSIQFLGEQNNIKEFFSRVDLLVVPSIAYESFGMVVLEAMLHKKPVICSDFGGMKEIVVHGETGYICEAGNVKQLTETLTLLLEEPELCISMGNKGFCRLQESFSAKKMALKYDELLG